MMTGIFMPTVVPLTDQLVKPANTDGALQLLFIRLVTARIHKKLILKKPKSNDLKIAAGSFESPCLLVFSN